MPPPPLAETLSAKKDAVCARFAGLRVSVHARFCSLLLRRRRLLQHLLRRILVFFQVFRGTYHGTVVAAKAIFSQAMTANLEEIGREIQMLAALHHPNIITFYGVAKDAVRASDPNPLAHGTMFIVEEFCAGGNLDAFCSRTHPGFTPAGLAIVVQELLAAVRYMHSQGIAHRDLKPANGAGRRATFVPFLKKITR